MTLHNLPGTKMNLVRDTRQDEEEALAWKLTTEGLAKRLEEKNL